MTNPRIFFKIGKRVFEVSSSLAFFFIESKLATHRSKLTIHKGKTFLIDNELIEKAEEDFEAIVYGTYPNASK